jgi:outer membrane receptor protein involved in Fe transport
MVVAGLASTPIVTGSRAGAQAAPGTAAPGTAAPAARAAGPIAGVVRTAAGEPVSAARLQLVELQRQVVTDSAGRFRFGRVPAGTYRLSVTRIGLSPTLATVSAGEDTLVLLLEDARVELGAVQVSASPVATTPLRAPQAMATLGGEPLREAQGRSLGETLEPVAGVRSISMTTGIGKPVIRGLSSQRVVTLDNGQRVESQQWGTDHAPTLETRDAERIEVIKGPASVLYGSDAIGGVVNVVARPLPDATGRAPFMQAGVATVYDSNLRGPEATVSLEGGAGGLGWRASATGRAMGDMRTPDGPLVNTENRTGNVLLAAGWRGAWGSVATRLSRRDERIEIFDDPVAAPDYTGFQRIVSERAKLEVRLPVRTGRVEIDVATEGNDRREFDDANADLHALGLTARTVTATAHWHDAPRRALGAEWQGMLGVAGMTQRFRKSGLETLVPDAGAGNAAVYGYQQGTWDRLTLSVGARWDVRTITAEDDDVLGLVRTTRSWNTWSGNLGATYALRDDIALVASLARGFRSPWYNELFANGFHEGTRAFERGDPSLALETSRNADLGVRVRRRAVTLDAGVFSNHIANYIYLQPFGTGPRVLDSLAVVQGDAWLRGGEIAATVQPVRWLTLDVGGDVTVGDNRSTGVPLPFIAPPRVTWGARLGDAALAPLQRVLGRTAVPSLRVSGEAHTRQARLDPGDVAPPGFTLWHLSAGVAVLTGRGPVLVDLVARNLFDARYRPFLSRYKECADAPGRALQLRVSVGTP